MLSDVWRQPGRRLTRRPGRPLAWLSGLGAGVLSLWVAAILASDPLPRAEIEDARAALSAAETASADLLAPGEMMEARAAWERAVSLLDSASAHRWWYRSFDSTRTAAAHASAKASSARIAAEARAATLSGEVGVLGDSVSARLARLELLAKRFPSSVVEMELAHTARHLQAQSIGAARKGNLARSYFLMQDADRRLAELAGRLGQVDDSLKARADEWTPAVVSLESHFPRLLVDKRSRTLVAHYAPGRVDTFRVELGPEWMGDKRLEGDRRTPEGLYRVRRKLDRGQSRYHRALLLDYPNGLDRSQFEEAKRSGSLPAHARIGGHIEIHGGGGRSGDWTDGCIALTNSDIERLFARVPLDTPVLIAPALSRPGQ